MSQVNFSTDHTRKLRVLLPELPPVPFTLLFRLFLFPSDTVGLFPYRHSLRPLPFSGNIAHLSYNKCKGGKEIIIIEQRINTLGPAQYLQGLSTSSIRRSRKISHLKVPSNSRVVKIKCPQHAGVPQRSGFTPILIISLINDLPPK